MEKFPIQKFKVLPKLDTAIFDIYLNLSQPNIFWSNTLHPKSQFKTETTHNISRSQLFDSGDNIPPSRVAHVGFLLQGYHRSLGLYQGASLYFTLLQRMSPSLIKLSPYPLPSYHRSLGLHQGRPCPSHIRLSSQE